MVGANFMSADKILRKIIYIQYNVKLKCWILSENVEILFNGNPPGAPHHGGLLEGSCKIHETPTQNYGKASFRV